MSRTSGKKTKIEHPKFVSLEHRTELNELCLELKLPKMRWRKTMSRFNLSAEEVLLALQNLKNMSQSKLETDSILSRELENLNIDEPGEVGSTVGPGSFEVTDKVINNLKSED